MMLPLRDVGKLSEKGNITGVRLSFWLFSVSLLLLGVCAKLLYIFMMTRREHAHAFPFDSYLFNPFDRFTDWLIPLEWSKIKNPWDINSELAKGMPMCPYGPLTFLYLRATAFLGHVTPFFALVFGYLYVVWKLINKSLEGLSEELIFLIMVAMVVGFYPLHFIIDRGNTGIMGGLIIAIIYFNIRNKTHGAVAQENYLFEFLIVLLIGTKPTWGLTLIPLLFLSKVSFFRSGLIIFGIYAFPLVFLGVDVKDYMLAAQSAYVSVGGAINFSNDFVATFAVLTSSILDNFSLVYFRNIFLVIGVIVLLLGLFLVKKSNLDKYGKFYFSLTHCLLCTLLFNRPSPDYNLLFVIPALVILIDFLTENYLMDKTILKLLSLLFFSIGSWFTIYNSHQLSIWIPFRTLAILGFDLFIIFYCVNLNESIKFRLTSFYQK